ncbi:hypothetical protein IMZ48_10705 [Candidatus Bathyarchaeota archaeon]|nr:hypothetical protein [Candidatus Bathyarchaeota archaeon]
MVNGDAVRISHQIGIGEALTKKIGKGMLRVAVTRPPIVAKLTGGYV